MGEVTSRILSQEEVMHEENKRVNAERQILYALAPDKWQEMKDAFTDQCRSITAASRRLTLETAQTDEYLFNVNRITSGYAVSVLGFRYDPVVPRIIWRDMLRNGSPQTINLVLLGNSVHFTNGASGLVLPQFVSERMMAISRG